MITNNVLGINLYNFALILRKLSHVAQNSVISRFCLGGIPSRKPVQLWYFAEITTEMERSRAARIYNIKCYNFSSSMNQVTVKRPIRFFFAKKNRISGREWVRPLRFTSWSAPQAKRQTILMPRERFLLKNRSKNAQFFSPAAGQCENLFDSNLAQIR